MSEKIWQDHKMRRAFLCDGPARHVVLDALLRTEGRCLGCWPDCDWPADAPLTQYTEMTAAQRAEHIQSGLLTEYT